uniref:THIF-type NAD/FAD binding fold domain-containing protein n=1 Tax=Zea mays TaxID=4577 RepID=A0A804NLE7_MAIZE
MDGGGGAGGAEGELTAQETALYDRQIRVWGVDAQKRLSKAHVLVCGMNGTTIEFCKNIVLAGVGSLSLMDDNVVTEEDLNANFLIPPDESIYGDPSLIDGEFLDKFDIVVLSRASLKTKKKPGGATEQQELTYSSLQEAISVPWNSLPKKTAKLYFAMRVLEDYELSEGRSPGETTLSDIDAVLARRKDMCDKMSLNESRIPTTLVERLLAAGKKEHPPVCAILGGILGQEVIKSISCKGDPVKNFFYFDVADGKGVIEDIPPPPPAK